jgi:hypothetical protein
LGSGGDFGEEESTVKIYNNDDGFKGLILFFLTPAVK